MRRQKRFIQSTIFTVALCAFALLNASTTAAAEHLRFHVGVSPTLAYQPVSGRLLIFMTNQAQPLKMIEPDFLNPNSVWASSRMW